MKKNTGVDNYQIYFEYFGGQSKTQVSAFDVYKEATNDAYNNYLIHFNKFYSMEQRWPESDFWTRRQK